LLADRLLPLPIDALTELLPEGERVRGVLGLRSRVLAIKAQLDFLLDHIR